MKLISIILFLLFTLNLAGQTVQGNVNFEQSKDGFRLPTIYLRSAAKSRFEMADNLGNFKFDNVAAGTYDIYVQILGWADSTYKQVKISGDTTLQLTVKRVCVYDASVKNKTCPTCHKKDESIPIVYGLPVGEKTLKNGGIKYVLAGCQITDCDPHWYCKRDKKRF